MSQMFQVQGQALWAALRLIIVTGYEVEAVVIETFTSLDSAVRRSQPECLRRSDYQFQAVYDAPSLCLAP